MSAKIMGEVWGLALPREQKYVLLRGAVFNKFADTANSEI